MTTAQDTRPSIARRKRALAGAPVALWLPALLVALLMVFPILYLLIRASEGRWELVDLLWRARTFQILRNTIVLTVVVTLGSIAVALPVAWLTSRTDLPLRRVWTVATALPLVIPSYVGAFAVIAALGPRGMVQGWLERGFAVERLPEIYGLFGASLTLILFSFPYVLLPLRAALSGMDHSLEEASRSMGFGSWTTFWRVTVPQLRPALAAGSLLVAFYTLSDFGAVSLLQYDSFTRAIYVQYQSAFDRTLAAGLALVLVVLTGLVLTLEAWTRGGSRYHRGTVGATRPARSQPLGRWKPLALGYCATIVSLALVMPIGVISYWLFRGLSAGEPLRLVWQAAWNSAFVALIAALVAVVAAAPVVVLSVRYPGRLTGLIERVTYAGYALPGIVIALSLVFFGVRYARPLYQTLAMLIVAYVIRFLPQAIGSLRASFLQVSPHIEEAARGLGSTTPRVWLRVTGPLVRPGLLSGGTLVFLTVMKELPATLLLRPIGFDTLATRIWSATAEGFWARAAAPALLLIVIAAIPMIIVSWREERH
ncbi:MAG TPA: iron ABC transporter permease [Thermomicrobiales bacterium]|nr:iron ABC transporter permease [Thermomicrobiales bacterium]